MSQTNLLLPFTRRRWLVGTILLVSLALRWFLVVRGGAYYWTDEKRYNATREAVAAVAAGDWHGAAQFLLSRSDHILFRWAALPPAIVERLIYGDMPPNAKLCAAWFALAGVASLALVWLIARRMSSRSGEPEWALAFAASSTSLLFFARHCFPYDASLAFFLGAVYVGLGGASLRRSFAVGLACGAGYLMYNGYWSVGAVVALLDVIARREPVVARLRRAAVVFAGIVAPVALMFGAAAVAGYNLLADMLQFAGTVNQGDFDGAGRFIVDYVFITDGLWPVGVALLVVLALGLTLRRRTCEPWHRWVVAVAALVVVWVLCCDVWHKFVLYGRTVRAAVPFLALAAAGALTYLRATTRRWTSGTVVVIGATTCLAGVWMMRRPIEQSFPVEFRAEAAATITRAQRGDPHAEFRTTFADYLYRVDPVVDLPPIRRVWLRAPHPLQYEPYLFEGCTRTERAQFLAYDCTMQLLELDRSRGLERLDFAENARALRPALGPVLLRVRFPARGEGEEWLLQGAAGPKSLDLAVRYMDARQVRFVLRSGRAITATSEPIAVDDLEHSVWISTGPGGSRVNFDGAAVISTASATSALTVADLRLGGGTLALDATHPFSGQLVGAVEMDPRVESPASRPGVAARPPILGSYFGPNYGPIEMDVELPQNVVGHSQVLLSAGRPGLGEQIFIRFADARHVRLGLDHWGGAPLVSPPIEVTPGRIQRIVISMGALFPPQTDPRYETAPEIRFLRRWVYVRVNDTVALSQGSDEFPCRVDSVYLGRSVIGCGCADSDFTGRFVALRHRSPESLGLSESALSWGSRAANPADARFPASVQMRFMLPPHWETGCDPLLVGGTLPNCDVVFLRYIGSNRVRIGFRHALLPPLMSAPFAIDRSASHTLRIAATPVGDRSSGSERPIQLRLALDGTEVASGTTLAYVSPENDMHLGNTLDDLKWVRMRFTGQIDGVEFDHPEATGSK